MIPIVIALAPISCKFPWIALIDPRPWIIKEMVLRPLPWTMKVPQITSPIPFPVPELTDNIWNMLKMPAHLPMSADSIRLTKIISLNVEFSSGMSWMPMKNSDWLIILLHILSVHKNFCRFVNHSDKCSKFRKNEYQRMSFKIVHLFDFFGFSGEGS